MYGGTAHLTTWNILRTPDWLVDPGINQPAPPNSLRLSARFGRALRLELDSAELIVEARSSARSPAPSKAHRRSQVEA